MAYVLALDQGTTSSRALLFDAEGRLAALAQQEFPQFFPRPGWVEHDPRDLWASQAAVAQEVLARAGLAPRDVAAIGITNQRETTLLWERATGRPVHNAIVWQDRRTAALCARLKAEGHEPRVRAKTGLVIDTYFSASKLAWLLDHVPGARARAETGELAFGTVDSWLLWNLSAGRLHATDETNAARTLLYDIHARAWDDELLALFGVPRAVLPEVRPSSGVFGECAAILPGVPLAGVAGDQQAALFGQACFTPGTAKNTYGTGCFLLLHTGARAAASGHGLLATPAAATDAAAAYALEGSIFVAGAAVQWLRDGLGVIATAAESEALAASVPDSGGVVFVPAFAGLGTPHWDAGARGTVLGLTRGTTRAHLARAALEGIAHQVADVVEAMQADSGVPLAELRADGGATANNLLMQFQADLLGVPVVIPEMAEATAQGAAWLAGLATGMWESPQQLAGFWRAARRFEPARPAAQVAARRERWRAAVGRAKHWAED